MIVSVLITLSYQLDGITPTSLIERTSVNFGPHPTILVSVVVVILYAGRRIGEVSFSSQKGS